MNVAVAPVGRARAAGEGPGAMIIYSDGPLWLRALIAMGAAVLFGVLAWRYYVQFWRRR